jgi:putative ABC transport system permease protein
MRLNLTQNVRNAFRALIANKLRTALTMLGIVIGVSSVVALLAIGTGAQAAITGQVQGLGSNLISIIAGKPSNSQPGQVNTLARLTLRDAEQLTDLSGVAAVAPQYRSSMRLTNQGNQAIVPVTGIVPDYNLIHVEEVELGRFLEASDTSTKARTVVLGSRTATDLFGELDPIGQPIKINGVLFTVVGVLKSKGGSGGFGMTRDTAAYVPLVTAYTKLVGADAVVGGDRLVSMIEVSALDEANIDTALSAVDDALRRAHKLSADADNDFTAISQTDLLSATATITGIMTVFLGAISGISLVVGGIGVMNIMLVSVTERTKEIGLRKAVGARRRDILYQFLTETVTLSLFGGIIGILVGAGIAALVNLTGVITTRVSIESIVLAFGFSAAVGIFFGIYPANRAAGLRPIEALRYE